MAHCGHFQEFVEDFFPETIGSTRSSWKTALPAPKSARLQAKPTRSSAPAFPTYMSPAPQLALTQPRQPSNKRYQVPTRRKSAPLPSVYGSPSAPAIIVVGLDPSPISNKSSARRRASQPLHSKLSKVQEVYKPTIPSIQRQKDKAFQENPNLFTKQTMLYVEAYIATKRLPLFVDTGAQASVMSLETCKDLGLEDQVDLSESGIAAGVGLAKIHGKLWRVPVSIGRTQFTMQFNILDMHGVRVILGLDQMKRLGMTIDLTRNGLVVGKDFIPFLQIAPAEENKPACVLM